MAQLGAIAVWKNYKEILKKAAAIFGCPEIGYTKTSKRFTKPQALN